MNQKIIRTRFAPSPTGFMHIGNVRTALYAYLFAKQHHGKFILRIEDTDQARKVAGAVEQIQKTLRLAGIGWDEGPYIQTERLDIYKEKISELVEKDGAYYCFCTEEQLVQSREIQKQNKQAFKYDGRCRKLSKEEVKRNIDTGVKYVVRQKIPTDGMTSFEDSVFGKVEVKNMDLDDAVLMKSNGIPTYNFAHVVDDHLMGITHVIRGTEFLSSTPKYVLLYEMFGWPRPIYIHLPNINKNSREKLSKRDGDATFEDLLEKGYLPEAIVNYVALLGWHPKDEREIFSLLELIQEFSLDGLTKSPAIFDINKLDWMNGQYIRAMDFEEFHRKALPYYEKSIHNKDRDLKEISRLLHERIEKFSDIPDQIDFFDQLQEYSADLFVEKRMKSTLESTIKTLEQIKNVLISLEIWELDTLKNAMFGVVHAMNVTTGMVLWPVRVALSGKKFTPGGAIEIAYILGRGETLKRISKALEKISV